MRVNVKSHQPLCRSCTHSVLVSTNTGISYAYCNRLDTKLASLPTECSGWESFLDSEPYDMAKRAWVMETKGRIIVGFRPPKKREE